MLRRYPDIAFRLIQCRLHFDIRQEDVAKEMKARGWPMSPSTYSTFENGTNPQSSVYEYWQSKGINLNWLLSGKGSMLISPEGAEGLTAQDVVRLIQSLDHEESVRVAQFLLAKTQAGSPSP